MVDYRKILLVSVLLLMLSSPQFPPGVQASHDDGVNGTVSVYLEPMPQGLWHTSAVTTPYGSFVFGGVNNAGTLVDTIMKFTHNPPDAATQTARLPAAIHSTSAIWDGTAAYIFGGTTASGSSDRIYRFDPAAPTASQVTELAVRLPTPRTATAAVWDGLHAYVMGGLDTDESNAILEFDPASETIQPAAMTLPAARSHLSAVWTGSMAIIFGGKDSSGNPTTDIYRFDPRASSATARIIHDDLPRLLHSTAAVWDGERAIVLGGRNDVEASRDVFVYNPIRRTMFDTELDGRREAPSAVFVDGHVDFFGGRNNTAVSTWIQKYTPPPVEGYGPTIEYELDPIAVQNQFLDDGEFVLQVPQDGVLKISAVQAPLYEGTTVAPWGEMNADGTVTAHPNPSIPIDGQVIGDSDSVVNMILGEYGVYGLITQPTSDGLFLKEFDFSPVEDPTTHQFTQTVTLNLLPNYGQDGEGTEIPSPPNLGGGDVDNESTQLLPDVPESVGPPPVASASYTWPPPGCTVTQSFVQLDVEPSLKAKHSDWRTRVEMSFKAHHGSFEMWKDICLELLIAGGTYGIRLLTANKVDDGYNDLGNYELWVRSNLRSASAYQLWTGKDLKSSCSYFPDSACLFGVAWGDSAIRQNRLSAWSTNTRAHAVSIVEGAEIAYDFYDATSTRQRGIISGHELSHIYGEGAHRDHCKSGPQDCNIMKEKHHRKDVLTYWVDLSRCEVYRRYFHEDNTYNKMANGQWEPCPNWYS